MSPRPAQGANCWGRAAPEEGTLLASVTETGLGMTGHARLIRAPEQVLPEANRLFSRAPDAAVTA